MSGVSPEGRDEMVRTTIYVERWLVEAAKKMGINVSAVARKALELAVSARSRSVRSKDVLEDERLIKVVREEYQGLIEEEELELEEARRRSEELRKQLEREKEHRRQAERALQVRRLKAWLKENEDVRKELMELLRSGVDVNEARAWLVAEKRAPFCFEESFREVMKWLLEQELGGGS